MIRAVRPQRFYGAALKHGTLLGAVPALLLAQQVPDRAPPPVGFTVVLADAPNFRATRTGKVVQLTLKRPHRVVSTSALTGGVTTRVKYLVNHQSLEPAAHTQRTRQIVELGRDGFHAQVAREIGVAPTEVAIIGTAANMNYVAWKHREYRDLRVDAFVTAGVETNATRAGDPTRWYEGDKGAEPVADKGTINTILIISQPLAIGADVRAAITMVEAKSAALAELGVGSRQSPHLATGTGTDQFILAAPIDSTKRALTDPGAHFKLGELIGSVVKEATLEALRWQNGLEPSYTRDIGRILGRFGLTDAELLVRLKAIVSPASYDVLANNRLSVIMEPRVAAATFAYATVLDRLQYGSLPETLRGEVLRDQAANVAVALSAKPERWMAFWQRLPDSAADPLAAYVQAIAMGWEARWSP
jgi:adenosylcobinamide amidohydrolase